jgi:hypothetical protein
MIDRASELRAIADGRLMLNVRNGVTVARSMLARIADEFETMSIALAAKDAKLAAVHQRYVDANEARIDAEAQLAEARKALDALTGPEADMRDYHEGIVGSLAAKINAYEAAMEPFAKAGELFADPSPDYAHLELIWRPAAGDAYALYADHLRAARRAREGGRDA